MERRLSEIYYSTGGYWKGYAAIGKLVAKSWLEKQELWQIYLPPPKYIPRVHWVVDRPNYIQHVDLLYLSNDTQVQGEVQITFKYALVVVDVSSRYVDAEALLNKFSARVARAFERIYSRRLTYPKTLIGR